MPEMNGTNGRKKGRRMSDAERAALPDRKICGEARKNTRADFGGAPDQLEWARKRVDEKLAGKGMRLQGPAREAMAELVRDQKLKTAEGIRNRTFPYIDEMEKRLLGKSGDGLELIEPEQI